MERERQAIDASCRRCLISGILTIALPVSGIAVLLLMAFAFPSSYIYNEFGQALRIYYGLVFLLPVPLSALALAFFISGMRRLHRDPSLGGKRAAIAGLVVSAVSVALFLLALVVFPTF
jgi:hypothetical protein